MINFKDRQKEINNKFEQIKKEIGELQQILSEKQAELLRLQGEWRLLEELQKEELENKKDKKI